MRHTPVLAALLVTGVLLSATPVSAAPESCAAFGGVVQRDNCRVRASTAEYTIDMTFPLNYPDEQALFEYLTETRDGFVNVGQTPDARNIPHEMDITARSFESAQTRSVVLTLFQDVGSAHPTTWYRSFTYDVGRGRPVTFDTLFAADAKPLDSIFPIVQRTLEGETGLVGSISAGDGRDPAHYQNFAVTDDSVIFFFGRAELLPSVAGATSVTVPRNAIPPLQL